MITPTESNGVYGTSAGKSIVEIDEFSLAN
jgi:hypothetical protein